MTLLRPLRFNRAPRQVLYLVGHQMTVYQWRDGHLSDALMFQSGEEGLADFSAYLHEAPGVPAMLLADVVEEEYRRDTIPHLYGKDRGDLIRHRAGRLFRETNYWNAVLQGRETTRRKDDQVLYTALTNPGLLDPWLERLDQTKVPLMGIYSLPLLSEALLPYLGIKSEPALLVSIQSAGNLRQSFFMDGRLKVSRLAHMPALETAAIGEALVDEVEKIRRYLNSLRLLSREKALDVHVLSHGELLDTLERLSPDSEVLHYRLHDTVELGAGLGLSEAFASAYADALFAQLLLRHRPSNHYARPRHTRYFTFHRIRNAMFTAAALSAVGALAWGGLIMVDGLIYQQRSAATRQQADYYQQRYNQARAGLPATPAEATDLKAVVDVAATLREHQVTPLKVFNSLSIALETFPTLKIEGIDWRVDTDPSALSGGGGLVYGGLGDGVYELAIVQGRVEPFDGDYRHALRQVRAFAETLRGLRGVRQVTLVSLPLNVSPHENLSGDAGDRKSMGQPTFRLKLVYGGKHEGV